MGGLPGAQGGGETRAVGGAGRADLVGDPRGDHPEGGQPLLREEALRGVVALGDGAGQLARALVEVAPEGVLGAGALETLPAVAPTSASTISRMNSAASWAISSAYSMPTVWPLTTGSWWQSS